MKASVAIIIGLILISTSSCDPEIPMVEIEKMDYPLTSDAQECIDDYLPPTGNFSRDLLCEKAHRLTCLGFPKDHIEIVELCTMFHYENWGSTAVCPVC